MKIQRTLPPAAAPLKIRDLLHGVAGIFSGEKAVRRFEEDIGDFFGVRHVFAVSSGKAALTLILLALKELSPRREVIIPAYTCYSVPSAIIKAGLKIKLCDINLDTFDFNNRLLEQTVTKETLCIIPSNLFGIPSNIDKVNYIAKNSGTFIVEDAAQAMGEKVNGRYIGTYGDVGFFSLGRGKNITCGSGGVIMTNSDEISYTIAKHCEKIEKPGTVETLKDIMMSVLMSLFLHPRLFWLPSGLSFLKLGDTIFYRDFPIKRLSGWQGGLLRSWKEHLSEFNNHRKDNGTLINQTLGLRCFTRNGIPYLRLPLLVRDKAVRDRIFSISRRDGLGISKMYPKPVNEIEEISADFSGESYPCAKDVSEKLLMIPTHPLINKNDINKICNLIRNSGYLN